MKTTIAINIDYTGFKTIEAEKLDIYGIPCGVHRRVNKAGWAVTHVGTGLVLAKGVSRVEVIAAANVRIDNAGVDKVKGLIAAQPAAPAVDTLEAYVAPAKPTAPTINVQAIIIVISDRSGVSSEVIRRVICSKGKNRGRLISKCPPIFGPKADKEAAAVWLGIQPNPFKVSVGKVLFLDKENQELALRLGKIKWPAWLDSDKVALVAFGVW